MKHVFWNHHIVHLLLLFMRKYRIKENEPLAQSCVARKEWNGYELKLAWPEVYTPPLCLGVTPMLLHGTFKVSSVQFSHPVLSYSLWPHWLQHTRPPVHHQLLELAQTHVHQVGDAIQPSHLLLSPPRVFSLSQHQGLFQLVSSSHQVAKVLEFQL